MEMEAEIEAAVNWWAIALLGISRDNGDDLQGIMLTVLAAKEADVTPDQLGAFKEHLAAYYFACVERDGNAEMSLGVDYGPDKPLADAAQAAGISLGRFPCKTMMWIEPGEVTVSAGYGRPVQTIYGGEKGRG